jgi:hypothetical protein
VTDKERIIAELLERAKKEDWSDDVLYDEIWSAAVEWADGLVDYAAS